MAFEKGKSGNPAGRVVGSKNKLTTAIKEKLTYLLDKMTEAELDEMYKECGSKELFRGLIQLAPKDINLDASTNLIQAIKESHGKRTE